MKGILGCMVLFAGDFEPPNWAFCDGKLLLIASNPSLFAVIGNVYGGDGKKTFALPDLRGRAIMGRKINEEPGKEIFVPGYKGGNERLPPLNTKMIPDHSHQVNLIIKPKAGGVATTASPENNVFAANPQISQYEFVNEAKMAPYKNLVSTSVAGTDSPIPLPVLHPVLALNYIICVQVSFPDRDQ